MLSLPQRGDQVAARSRRVASRQKLHVILCISFAYTTEIVSGQSSELSRASGRPLRPSHEVGPSSYSINQIGAESKDSVVATNRCPPGFYPGRRLAAIPLLRLAP